MRSNSKHSVEELDRYIKMYLEQAVSYRELRDIHGLLLSDTIFRFKVLKYQEHGPAGLIDGSGRGKPDSIQTDEESLRTEIEALKARNEYLETENAAINVKIIMYTFDCLRMYSLV